MTMNRTSADTAAVQLFHSLADPARLEIVRLLGAGERRVVDLTAELGLAQSTVSGHLSCLRHAGLVEPHPHGRSTYYALIRPELWAMLAAAEDVLAAAGSPARLCPDGAGAGAGAGAAGPHADAVVPGHRARPDTAAPATRPGQAH
ncbi:ArsR/SmtB family transcription factor [Jiangella mangrovi]|uniref:DNA-binding transcriptional ArsR family regulator n=1 Tax=Jiangella mangrovi TaxID=1524084 RepID=A0A7W9GS10_9ACTN|nr:metalloregulator ArsR/SmtB family transcription factor [Jiangella mangrovi]MBB5788694.1 DNA-binding transcriptional ArsR family regulator [Jiangella mangrovi]